MNSMCLTLVILLIISACVSTAHADSLKNTVSIGDCTVTNVDGKSNFECKNVKPCSHVLTLGGATGGTYEVIANIISGIAHASGTRVGTDCASIEIDSGSAGSQENCRKVGKKPNYELGIVQADVFFESKDGCQTGSEDNFVVLRELHDEYVHILARSDIKDIGDLQGKKVSIGEEGSGTIFTARKVLDAHGIKVAEKKYSTADALNMLLVNDESKSEKSIHAMFYVGGAIGSIFKEKEKKLKNTHFLSLTSDPEEGSYQPAEIPVDEYKWEKKKEIKTWKQKALLVTYNWDSIGDTRRKTCDLVRKLNKKIGHYADSINDLYSNDLYSTKLLGGPFTPNSPNTNTHVSLKCN